jgi:hypothetical protein
MNSDWEAPLSKPSVEWIFNLWPVANQSIFDASVPASAICFLVF